MMLWKGRSIPPSVFSIHKSCTHVHTTDIYVHNSNCRIDCCINDCILFYDATNFGDYQHAHRTKCHICGERRYVEEPGARGNKPRKTVYYFPVAGWLQSLFRRPDLCKYLSNETSPSQYPSGHVRRSWGWHTKVTNNVRMNKDERNQALIGSCDGVCTHSCTRTLILYTYRTHLIHISCTTRA